MNDTFSRRSWARALTLACAFGIMSTTMGAARAATDAAAVSASTSSFAASAASATTLTPAASVPKPVTAARPGAAVSASTPAHAVPTIPGASAASAAPASTSAASAASAASTSAASASAASASAPLAASAPPLTLPARTPFTAQQAAEATRAALDMRARFDSEVTRRLRVPAADQRAYGDRLQAALDAKDLGALAGEFVILVDRATNVQALFVYFRAQAKAPWTLIGASPVATGRPGEFDHFLTPLGVFEHTPLNMDYRAEGTMNQNGIRGYGKHDMRIYDFGWVDGERGWGKGGYSQMRFQMHATDPDRLEPLLGIRHSKGCVRIPATLNAFIDHHGIIDAEYQALVDEGKSLWVLHANRQVTPLAGRFLVVIDTQRKTRPAWSPAPGSKARAKMPASADTAD